MSAWLDNLQKQPQSKKIRLLWTIVAVSIIILAAIWAITQHYSARPAKANTSFFDTFGQGFRDFRNYFKK